MRKVDLLYSNLISSLADIVSNEERLEAYNFTLSEASQEIFIDIIEQLDLAKKSLVEARDNLALYNDLPTLTAILQDFKSNFADFQEFRLQETFALVAALEKLINELSGDDDLNLEEELNVTIFSLLSVSDSVVNDMFFAFDTAVLENSIFLFDHRKNDIFKEYIDDISHGVQILFHLLHKIGDPATPLTNNKHIMVRTDLIGKPAVVVATLNLHIIKMGKIVHEPQEYNLSPLMSPNLSIDMGKDYQQFNDSINIISEYNYQKDILDKYLRIYHVFENFMYKSPLVDIERRASGDVFSIRDFQRMYENIHDSELNMLKKLFERILAIEESAGVTYSQRILTHWQNLIPTHFADATMINHLLVVLNMKTPKGTLIDFSYPRFTTATGNTIPAFFSKLVYMFRNSIVHNRETEFHLTHANLITHPIMLDCANQVLEKFLLPCLEELAFELIIKHNTVVWYQGSTLQLWNET